jgi:hypothetical protein
MDSKPILNLDVVVDIQKINSEYPQINEKDFFPISTNKKEISNKIFTVKKRKREDLLVTDN